MKGGKNRQPLGYTIIEVMIVLAISGVMFLIASQFINGKQEKTSFNEGVHDMASQIQDIIEQVTDGRYSDIPLACKADDPVQTSGAFGTDNQGNQQDCVFAGKAIVLQTGGTNYRIFTDVMCRTNINLSCGNTTGPDYDGQAFVVGQDRGPDLTIQTTTPQDLTVHSLTIKVDPTYVTPVGPVISGTLVSTSYSLSPTDNLLFYQSNGSESQSFGKASQYQADGNYQSGAQTVGLAFVIGTAKTGYLNPLSDSSADNILYSTGTALATYADICLTDGTRYAEIMLGSSNNASPLSPVVKMDGTGTPLCQ
jgi:prepilin-type N-terminal cleavage/methylation domain-containing protein